jgi:hypothetical protein
VSHAAAHRRARESGKHLRRAIRTAKAKEPKQEKTKEKVMDKKLCKCGCGEALSEGAVREYKNGHKPKAEKKSGGRALLPLLRSAL